MRILVRLEVLVRLGVLETLVRNWGGGALRSIWGNSRETRCLRRNLRRSLETIEQK